VVSTQPGRASTVPGFTNRQLLVVLGALIIGVLLAALDTSIVTTALPTIAGELNGFSSYAWVGTAYIVTSTIATPLLGKLSDLYGRRALFQTTIGIFLAGSVLCAMAHSMNQLILFRGIQGIGGGGIQALAFAILGDILPPRERGRYIGFFTAAFAVAAVAGPLVGGFMIERWSWPWIFLLNVPLCLIAGTGTHFALRLPFSHRHARLDYLGAALLTGGLGSLMVALARGQDGWTSPPILALFGAAAALLVAFVLQEQRAAEPMIPLRLFGIRIVTICCVLGALIGTTAYGASAFLPLYFQDALFVKPTNSGLRMIPVMFGVTAASFYAGRRIARTGRYRIYPIVGIGLSIIGLYVLTGIDGATPYSRLLVPMALVGIASGAAFTTTSIAVQNAADLRDLGVATATLMFFRSLGGSIGLAVYGTVLNATVNHELPKRLPAGAVAPGTSVDTLIRDPRQIQALPPPTRTAVVDSIAQGVSTIFWVALGVTIVAFVFALLLPEIELRAMAGLSEVLTEGG